ncbi:MAG TPA: Wzz/FepE/Etk N-terminal domain-containing protein, partial [Chloroflexota bacterium]|nr:Wzz/FepE/Etk N-terminal domain-containing protein [Chloroflexota bacterium]
MEQVNPWALFRKWWWLILTVTLVTVGATVLRLRQSPSYEAQVTLEVTAPQVEDVSVLSQYRTVALQDQVTDAENNLTSILNDPAIFNRTASQLGLPAGGTPYDVTVTPSREADFVTVTVDASSPDRAAVIANAHVRNALDYYGEARAKPAIATRDYLAAKLRTVQQQLSAARAAQTQLAVQSGVPDVATTASADLQLINTTTQQSQDVLNQMALDRQRAQLQQQANLQLDAIQQTQTLLTQLRVARTQAAAQGNDVIQSTTLNDKLLSYDQAIAHYTAELETLKNNAPVTKEIQNTSDLLFELQLDRERLSIQGDTSAQKIALLDQTIANYASINDNMQRNSPHSETAKLTAGLLEELRAERQSLVTSGDQSYQGQMARIDATIAKYTQQLQALQSTTPTTDAIQVDTRLIAELKSERDQLAAQKGHSADAVAQYDQAIAQYSSELQKLQNSPLPASAPPAMADNLANQKAELQRVLGLQPRFADLQDQVNTYNSQYTLLQQKYAEADLTADLEKSANNIQIVQPAVPPTTSTVSKKDKVLIALAAFGSLGAGAVLAYLIELFGPAWGRQRRTLPALAP